MTMGYGLRAAAWAAALTISGGAWAGSIAGTVRFEGEVPPLKPVDMGADAACAAMHSAAVPNEVLVLGPGQTMANILVHVTKGAPANEHPAPAGPVVLTQAGCRYAPRVFVARVGQPVKVLNPDGILHNVHSMPKTNTALNKAMSGDMTELETSFDKAEPTPFGFKCDLHPWMQAWCAVLDHPYWSITKEDGAFSIEGLDPGTYEVTAWHERLGTQTAMVTVAEGAATQDFTFSRNTPKK